MKSAPGYNTQCSKYTSGKIKPGVASIFLLAASAMACTPAMAQDEPAAASSEYQASIVAAMDKAAYLALAKKTTPGIVIGVSKNGKLVAVRGYGLADIENSLAFNEHSVLRIGSISKEFTAASILKLMERGELRLEGPVSKYLPDFPRGNEVTIRNLLNHTSGIRNYTGVENFLSDSSTREFTMEGMIDLIATLDKLYDFEPGTQFSYSNSGYYLLGAIVEKITGKPFEEFAEATLFVPLGLNDTQFDNLDEIVPNRARGYEASQTSSTGFSNARYISLSVAGAAGAARSTAADLLRWHDALLGGKVLKPQSLEMMLRPGRLKDGSLPKSDQGTAITDPSEGYGFAIVTKQQYGYRTVGHGGSINGFNSKLLSVPAENISIVIMTNTVSGTVEIADDIFAAILKASKREK